MSKNIKLKAVDFFCGAGGMTYGFTKANINVLAGIDIDISCKETYEINNPGSKFIHADIHRLNFNEFSELTTVEKKDDSMIFVCCTPCQFWTKINTQKKKSENTKNLLYEFERFVYYFKPGYIVIENVPGLYKKKAENALLPFLDFLKENSYYYDHGLVNAHHLGVPQHRIRYLLIGTRVSDKINLPKKEKKKGLTLRNFIGEKNGFPRVNSGYKDKTTFLHTVSELSKKNKKRIIETPRDGGTRLSWKNNQDLQLECYRGMDHIFKDVYGRMFWDKPAPTITTRFNSLSNGRFGHPEENRAISLREGATLQSFPLHYKFIETNITTVARQIGNAVPPEMAKHIGIQIINNHKKGNYNG